MAILAVAYGYFLAAAIARPHVRWIWGVLARLLAGGTATFLVQRAWWDSEDIPDLRKAITNGQGFDGTDEYDPLGDDHYNLPEKAPRVNVLPAEESGGSAPQAQIHISTWPTQEKQLWVKSRPQPE